MPNFQEPYNQLSEHDEKKLEWLVSQVNNGFMCEVGCWTGHSTSIIGKRAKELDVTLIVIDSFKGNIGTPLSEFAIDHNVREMFVDNMNALGLFDNICLFSMDSLEASKFVKDKSLSFLFIDANHHYPYVASDLEHYLPKMKDGGIICGHDYESETYDDEHIFEDYVDGKHHGVIKAVNEVFGKVEHEGRMWWVKLKN